MKMNYLLFCGAIGALCGCNSVYLKPSSMEPGAKVYARYGGYSMRRSIKQSLRDRGFDVMVHKPHNKADDTYEGDGVEMTKIPIPIDAKYVVRVIERRERFMPLCALSGFWWWNFNVSISDQKTGQEILAWRGRGCADGSVRRLNRILDKMEKTNDQ